VAGPNAAGDGAMTAFAGAGSEEFCGTDGTGGTLRCCTAAATLVWGEVPGLGEETCCLGNRADGNAVPSPAGFAALNIGEETVRLKVAGNTSAALSAGAGFAALAVGQETVRPNIAGDISAVVSVSAGSETALRFGPGTAPVESV
jgi:hypothetical protein